MANFFGSPGPDFLLGGEEDDVFENFLGGGDFIDGQGGFDTLDARISFTFGFVEFQITSADWQIITIVDEPVNPGEPPLLDLAEIRGIEKIISSEASFSNFIVTNDFFNNPEDPEIGPNRDLTIVVASGGVFIDFASDFVTGTVDFSLAQGDLDINMVTSNIGGALFGNVVNARTVIGSDFRDVITTTPVNLLIEAGGGDDFIRANLGNNIFDGGEGLDTVDYVTRFDFNGLIINLAAQQVSSSAAVVADAFTDTIVVAFPGGGVLDQLISIENALGSNLADTLIAGSSGSSLSGRNGDDTVVGGVGSDTLNGNNGDDFIVSTAGVDTINGGANFDTVSFQAFASGSQFTITNGQWLREDPHGGVQSRVQDVESVEGTSGSDTFTVAADFVSDGESFINIRGGLGNDRIEALGDLGAVTIRADYRDGQSGVIADLETGEARSAQPADLAGVGVDTLIRVTQLRGSSFGDQLFGSNNDVFESFRGDAGNDFIDGRGGEDRLDYRSSVSGVTVDMALGITANDGFGFIDVFQNIELVRGSAFADQLSGDENNNFFQPRGGNDIIDGRGGIDVVDYRFEAVNGIGLQIDLSSSSTVQSRNAAADGSIGVDSLTSVEFVRGSVSDDIFNVVDGFSGSSDFFNVFEGLAGDDEINGNGVTRIDYDKDATAGIFADLKAGIVRGDKSIGRDTVSGIFEVRGTAFNDRMFGKNINPIGPDGDEAFETFEGLAGNDLIVGRGGDDVASYSQSIAGVNVNLMTGLARDGFNGIDTLFGITGVKGSAFDDEMIGDAGDNLFDPGKGGGSVDGGDGVDELTFRGVNDVLTTSIDIDLRLGIATHENGDVLSVVNIENVVGGDAGDDIIGSGVANEIVGEKGDDRLIGLAGNDTISGDEGSDVLFGNSGDDALDGGVGEDRLVGGFGADTLVGGRGNDSYVVDNIGDDVIEQANGGMDIDSVFSTISFGLDVAVENLSLIGGAAINGTGNGINNAITGNDAANTLRGGGGDDTLQGGGGDDTLIGQADGDLLIGGDGDDLLMGQGGDDELDGGRGNDELCGGPTVGESDIFKFRPGDGIDIIRDFELGVDFLDMTAFLFGDASGFSEFFSRVGANVRFEFDESTEITFIGVSDIPFEEIIL